MYENEIVSITLGVYYKAVFDNATTMLDMKWLNMVGKSLGLRLQCRSWGSAC
jgi:hypothetical protein